MKVRYILHSNICGAYMGNGNWTNLIPTEGMILTFESENHIWRSLIQSGDFPFKDLHVLPVYVDDESNPYISEDSAVLAGVLPWSKKRIYH